MAHHAPPTPDDSATLSGLKRAAGGAVALGLSATLALSAALGLLLGAPVLIPAAAGAVYALAAAVAWRWLDQHLPHHRLGAANRVTVARAALVATLAGLAAFSEGAPGAWTETAGWCAIALAATALSLDGVDGWAARRFGASSPFGARIDQELDGLTTLLLALLVWLSGPAGPWVLAAGLWRYGFLAAQPFAPALRRALPASAFRRIACGTSVGLLIAALGPIFPDWMQTALAGSAVALLSTSFLRDIIWLVREEEDAENRPQDPEDGPRQTEASDR